MGYQALLFCPDEKTARTVTQVLSDLDFTVIPCTEPFAAVKKMMAEHFDAVVVDCDNDQNATLLFKSARNMSNNQASLAVAVVEGQAGVAKAFRIGANLVLTKPINVDQAKGTLRVARGLLRKSEASKPGAAAASAANVKSGVTVEGTPGKAASAAPTPPVMPFTPVPAAASGKAWIPVDKAGTTELMEATPREIASGTTANAEAETNRSKFPFVPSPETKPELNARAGYAGSGSGAASAPAPARETARPTEGKVAAVITEAQAAGRVAAAASGSSIQVSSIQGAVEPTLTLGDEGKGAESGGGGKKAVLAVAAIVVIAVVGFEAWLQWGGSKPTANVPAHTAVQSGMTPTATPAASLRVPPATSSTADAAPSPKAELAKTSADTSTHATVQHAPSRQNQIAADADSGKPAAASQESSKIAATKKVEQPIVIKNDLSARNEGIGEAPAVSMNGIAAAGSGVLPKLAGDSKTPAPLLQRINVSQGVSRGLLIKQVQPTYPASALRMRIEGTVQLLATVSKSGNIAEVKIVSGDAQLARAAADAVKQWKYKPYLLNGEPVDIETQVTVNFKLPR